MAQPDRARWDRRYADPSRRHRRGANPFLVRNAPPARPGSRALELACGLGRDALWLAAQGYTVDALDISLTALRRARAEMRRRGLRVHFVAADLDHIPLAPRPYDLVYVYRFLDRRLFGAIRAFVRPGGVVIYETLNVRRLHDFPDTSPDHMLALDELPTYFPGWEVLEASDDGASSRFAGRKPVLSSQ